MFIHPYHYRLMRCLVRQKVKGDHRIPLTCADREALVDSMGLQVSKSHILKVLSEGERARDRLSQFVLDELMRCIGQQDWNAFLRHNPVPDGQFDTLMLPKAKKLLMKAVEARIQEIGNARPTETPTA
jgi:hypothetical protein